MTAIPCALPTFMDYPQYAIFDGKTGYPISSGSLPMVGQEILRLSEGVELGAASFEVRVISPDQSYAIDRLFDEYDLPEDLRIDLIDYAIAHPAAGAQELMDRFEANI
jgi:cytosine/adenosine deaminase-related metal-dependent hydrolase